MQIVYFIEFLKVSGRFEALVGDCPLVYASPNAPEVRDVIGTWVLSVLAGHKRYAHITALRSDRVLAELLGLERIVSEDSVRRALKALPEAEGLDWLQRHLDQCTHPLLGERYIIDIDTTVKPLYGHQEGAVVSYNPKKPGRPSHALHTYMLAGLRLVLGVETAPGDEHTGAHSAPGLWALIDAMPPDCRPALLRGDTGVASEGVMREAEGRGLDYLFKLRLTKNVKRLIERTFSRGGWSDAGQGWQGKEETLRLVGWSRQRRVVVLRRRLKDSMVASARDEASQLRLSFPEIDDEVAIHEYAVLVTSLDAEALTIAQLYRDRADCENVFDELKNQWGWGGFTTHDLKRCRFAARMVALVYNWWNIFVRLAEPDKHPAAAGRYRRAHPTRPPDHAQDRLRARPRRLGAARAHRRRPFPSSTDRCCGAVDGRPAMGPHPGSRRPLLAQGPPAARAAAAHGAGLTPTHHTIGLQTCRKIATARLSTAGLRFIGAGGGNRTRISTGRSDWSIRFGK